MTDYKNSNSQHRRPAWLPYEEYPFENRFVEIEGNQIHYIREGEGPVLLFLHAPFWSFVFRDVISVLRHDFQCIALDLPGTGLSKIANNYEAGLPQGADMIDAFVRRLDLRDITLVAHDIAGSIGLDVARRLPERFRGVAMTGSFAWPLKPYAKVADMLRFVGGSVFGTINRNTNLLARLSATSMGVGRRLSKEGRKAFLGPFHSKSVRHTTTRMLKNAVECESFLERIEAALKNELQELPVLLLYGERDQGRRAGFQDHFLRLMPHACSFVIEGANHFPQADAPNEVANHILKWWTEKVQLPVRDLQHV